MARLVALAQRAQIAIQLAYYPPYHSKSAPLAGLSSTGGAAYWTGRQTHPEGDGGARKNLFRLPGLEKWFVEICPAPAQWSDDFFLGLPLDKPCLDRRLPTAEKMASEVKAWQRRRNRQRKTINWSFTKEKADKKLEKHYVDAA